MRDEHEDTGNDGIDPAADAAPDGIAPPEDGTLAGQHENAAQPVRAEEESLAAAVERLQAENAELNEKNLLLLAEMTASRQRLEREKEEFKKYAVSEFAGDMLAVADNISRARDAIPEELAEALPALQSLVEGVDATERILLSVLGRHQITRFNPLGEPFDPHFHDARTKVNIPDVPANTVVHVLCAGYMIAGRLLRAAEVAVAAGGQASSRQAPPAYDAPDDERNVVLFRRPGFHAPGAYPEAQRREEEPPRKSSILQKAIITPTDGIPAATHPIWERLVTGQIKHRFKMFAANLLVDRARREYAGNRGAKARLASEICTFCNRYAALIAAELEPVMSAAGKIPPANHPLWESLVTGRTKHRFKLFAANLLIDRARRDYANNRAAKAALAAELCRFFNEQADLTAPEFEKIA